MADRPLRLLYLVAHPDDAEFHAGGLAVMYRQLGHEVRIVTLTNGDAGHQELEGIALAERRRGEAEAAARVIGATADVWEHPDGHLQPTLDVRWEVVREIRRYRPDLVLTHRTNDYHPDHRAVGHLVRDASYLVTVPNLAADTPALEHDPVVMFMPDHFTRPYPLVGDVVIDTTDVVDKVVEMLACHRSQVFEWLPYNRGMQADVPLGEAGRRRWLKTMYLDRLRPYAGRYRKELIAAYGAERGSAIEYCEVFEASEYAAPLDEPARRRLFPFLPA